MHSSGLFVWWLLNGVTPSPCSPPMSAVIENAARLKRFLFLFSKYLSSILSLSLVNICSRSPLKNHGVLSDVNDGRYIQFSKLSYEKRPTYDMKIPASRLMPCIASQ